MCRLPGNPERRCQVLPLIQTLTDITLLRKGPESIPRAGVLLVMVLGLWLLSSLFALVFVEHFEEPDFFPAMLIAVIGLSSYALLVIGFGHSDRVLQTITAILGCGALIGIAYVATYTLLRSLAGESATVLGSQLVAWWAIPVEGHIIARAISQHWYVGIVLAFGIYIFQLMLYAALWPSQTT